MGAKYVVFHPREYVLDEEAVKVIGERPDLNEQPGLELIKRFDKVEVYRVVARPVELEGTIAELPRSRKL